MGTILSYVFYWLAVIVVLVYTKYKEVYIHNSALRVTADSFFTLRAERKFSDTNPKPVFALGNAKNLKRKITSTTEKRPQKKRTSHLL